MVGAISKSNQPLAELQNQQLNQTNQTNQTNQLTLEEFLALSSTEPESEYLKGKIYQKPMSQGEHSTLQAELVSRINQVAKPNKLAYARPELRCTFGGRSIVPDIVILEWANIPRQEDGRVAHKTEIPPDWIVEILSPEQSANRVIEKIVFSIEFGTKLGWLIDPKGERVVVFYADGLPEIKTGEEQLPALEIIKDWQLSAKDLFRWLYVE